MLVAENQYLRSPLWTSLIKHQWHVNGNFARLVQWLVSLRMVGRGQPSVGSLPFEFHLPAIQHWRQPVARLRSLMRASMLAISFSPTLATP